MKVIGDIINGARTIKSYGWENPFFRLVKKWRGKQMTEVHKYQAFQAISAGFFNQGALIICVVLVGYWYARGFEFDASEGLTLISLMIYLSG